jgi:hypothetical protein
MPLSPDWTTDQTTFNGTVAIAHTTVDPLVDARSLRIQCSAGFTGSPYACGAVFLDTATHSRGFVMGKIRTLLRINSGSISPDLGGIFCLGSIAAGITDIGSAYMFGPVGLTLQLRKVFSGLSDNGTTLLYNTGINMVVGTTKAIELEWKSSLDIFGGVRFVMSAGDATDFSDLTEIDTYVDESSPLLTSQSEGLFNYQSGVGESTTLVFDQTTVIETVIV